MFKNICLRVMLVVALMVAFCNSAYAFTNYRVQPGDNLSTIGKKFGIDYKYIKKANAIKSDIIRPGDIIKVPLTEGVCYQVKKGDNLYNIAHKFRISVEEIVEVNKLDNTLIYPGQSLTIPETQRNKEISKPAVTWKVNSFITEDDIKLLARLIHAEARGEDYEGKVAVGAVILNRLVSNQFPNSIYDIIYQKTKGGYQFTPVGNGAINTKPNAASIKAAQEAISGFDPTGGALFFYNPRISTDQWIKTLPVTKVIGNHVFAR